MTEARLKEVLIEALDVIFDEYDGMTREERFDRVLWAGGLTTKEATELDLFNWYGVERH